MINTINAFSCGLQIPYIRGVSEDKPTDLIARPKASGISHAKIAKAIGRNRVVATRILNNQRPLKLHEVAPLEDLLKKHGKALPPGLLTSTEDRPVDNVRTYVAVDLLPTFAGTGGGGTGDGDREKVLVPRAMIEDELRGRPSDFLVIEIRGDSMEPDFYQGDQLLVDKRDTNPVQPGPFAIWFEDAYLVKNAERTPQGLRIFSTNTKYREAVVSSDDMIVRIIGRPVWCGRRL